MKKQLSITARRCLIAALLFPFWGLGGLYATVTITPKSVNYSTNQVTFKVEWTGVAANNRVWVWVDLCPIAGTTPGTFAKAVLSSPATIPTGSLVTVAGNTRGFYVTTNPSTVTVTLDNAAGIFNWCAYGSDFPPNARENGSSYTLKGSPPFIITTASATFSATTNTFSGGTITALTDATGCPGVLCGKNGESSGLLDCCVNGTTNCNGACKTTGTYTQDDGPCTGACNTAYKNIYNQCGDFVSQSTQTYANYTCVTGCKPAYNYSCFDNLQTRYDVTDCQSLCRSLAYNNHYYYYSCSSTCRCYRCD